MSFLENPIIDENAKASEHSVLKVNLLLSIKNGFLSRTEIPDYGADLDVELIEKPRGASGRKFAVQIKSSRNFNFISEKKYISFSFKTSRLGYLFRRIPGHGIVVLFDSNSEKIYFDYIEEIITRLTDDRGNEEWKEQDSVNIHIPTKNILTEEACGRIHKRIQNRYNSVESLINTYGKEFNIPQLNNNIFNFSTPENIAEELKKHGSLLINSAEFGLLYDMLAKVTISEITSSNKLLFISAVTYTEIGKSIDADYFISKYLTNQGDYSIDDLNIIHFCKIKNDFSLGKLTNTEFLNQLESLRPKLESASNLLVVDLNILYSKVTALFEDKSSFDELLEKELISFFQTIESSDIQEKEKHLFNIFHSENIGGLALKYLNQTAGKVIIRENIGIPIKLNDRVKYARRLLKLTELPNKYYQYAYDYAKNHNDKTLMAHSLLGASNNFFALQFSIASLNGFQSDNDFSKAESNYRKNLQYSLQAHDLFLGLKLLSNTYQSLFNSFELKKLFNAVYDKELGIISNEELESRMIALCKELNIDPWDSQVDLITQRILNQSDKWDTIKDEEEHGFAKIFADSCGLPENRIKNIIADIKAQKIFEEKCKNPDIVLLQNLNHTKSLETLYAEPPTFILKSKKAGIESNPSTDINKLLMEFKHLCNDK